MIPDDSLKVQHLIVDSGAFIRGTQLHEIAIKSYTIPEVIREIKDEASRQRVLNAITINELVYREPAIEDIKWVSEFAKKTGDFASLSSVDIKVIALTYLLEREVTGGVDHLRKEPKRGKVIEKKINPKFNGCDRSLPGFYSNMDLVSDKDVVIGEESPLADKESAAVDEVTENDKDRENEYDSDDKEWITPSNIDTVKKQMSSLKIDERDGEEKPRVACITGDFAMQNVLLQIGLKVVSINNGLIIRNCKHFMLRCYACFKITDRMECKFCPKCGNLNTMKRVEVVVNEDGEKVIKINFRRPINIRGTRYSLGTPRGGKHAQNPILVADQPIPKNKHSKLAMQERKVTAEAIINDPDYLLRSNPFKVNDVNSRASKLGECMGAQTGRRNPNQVRKNTGNRKKNNNKNI